MSSYISIGFVANDNEELFVEKCKKIMEVNNKNIGQIIFKYPTDETCNKWNVSNEQVKNIDKMLKQCFTNELAEIIVDYRINEQIFKGILIKIRKKIGEYTGILFEISEDCFPLKEKINSIENEIIAILRDLLNIGFEYAYCDNEADIEYSIKEVMGQKNRYSILVTRENNNIVTKLASWKIDGLTSR